MPIDWVLLGCLCQAPPALPLGRYGWVELHGTGHGGTDVELGATNPHEASSLLAAIFVCALLVELTQMIKALFQSIVFPAKWGEQGDKVAMCAPRELEGNRRMYDLEKVG